MFIYKITSPSGKYYVGQTTKQIEDRYRQHINNANSSFNGPLYAAIRKYGDDMKLELIEECTSKEELNEREIYWIAELDATNREKGYNITKGGDGIDSETASALKQAYWDSDRSTKQREANSTRFKENNPSKKGRTPHNKGKKQTDYLTEEAAQRIREHNRKRWTPEARAARSEQTKRLWAEGAFANRPPPTKEANAKRSEANRGRKQTDYQRQRAKEARQKAYTIYWMDGRVEEIVNLSTFIKNSEIPSATMNHILYNQKSSPKWGIEKIVPKE